MASSAHFTSDHEDDDSTAGNSKSHAVFCVRRVLRSRETNWVCSHCTLNNPSSTHICEACSHSNADHLENLTTANEEPTAKVDGDHDEVQMTSWTCVHCTFINEDSMSHICAMCSKTHEMHLTTHFEDVKVAFVRILQAESDIEDTESMQQMSTNNSNSDISAIANSSTGREEPYTNDKDDGEVQRKKRQDVRMRRILVDNDLCCEAESRAVIRLMDLGHSEEDAVEAVKDFGVEEAEEHLARLEQQRRTVRRLVSNYDLSMDEALTVIELTQLNCDEELAVELVENNNEDQAKSHWLKLLRNPTALKKFTAAKRSPRTKNKLLLVMNLIEMGFEVKDIIAAVDGCSSVNEALTLIESKRECPCCMDNYTANDMITLFCNHEMCSECTVRYFTERIRDHSSVYEVVCPVSGCSDDNKLDYEYFNMLANQLKPLLDEEVFDLLQTKLRDQTIRKIEGFVYCTKCPGFGFLYDPYYECVTCPECLHSMCPKCKADWTEDHKGRSCDEVENMKITETYIESTLRQQGIQCPKCRWKFELSRGGCMHFTCTQCKHEFCEGCSQEFYKNKCKVFADCQMSFHAHHPRACPYYMRDNSVGDLERLFQINGVAIPASKLRSGNGHCQVLIQDSPKAKEKPCNAAADDVYQGLCKEHYKEHLTSCIYKLQLDPVYIFDEDKLIQELQRNRMKVPSRVDQEADVAYINRLIKVVIAEVPYDFKWPNRL